MFLTVFALAHVGLSVIGIGSGLTVMYGLFARKQVNEATAIFFLTTAATSVMGFGFPSIGFTRAQAGGVVFLFLLALAIDGWYDDESGDTRQQIYLVTATLALYFNVFVLVGQAFQKLAFLNGITPTQSGPAFVLSQLIVLVLYAAVGVLALVRSRHVPRARNFS